MKKRILIILSLASIALLTGIFGQSCNKVSDGASESASDAPEFSFTGDTTP